MRTDMAKKLKHSITHLKKKSKKSVFKQDIRSVTKSESLKPQGGYVSVRVAVKTKGQTGSSALPRLVLANPSDPRSVSIFIAGGSEVDRKVELANAKLLSDID